MRDRLIACNCSSASLKFGEVQALSTQERNVGISDKLSKAGKLPENRAIGLDYLVWLGHRFVEDS